MPDWETVSAGLPTGQSPEDKQKRLALWKAMNVRKSKYLALFELDAGIRDVLQCEELFAAKPAIQRAYNYAREVNPGGPNDKLEFCEFRLCLVYLQGIFGVYRVFNLIDKNQDNVLSLDEIEAAAPHLAAAGLDVPDPAAVWNQLKGTNTTVSFSAFADWATRRGLAGPELLERAETDDVRAFEDKVHSIKSIFNAWHGCACGLLSISDLKAVLKMLNPGWSDGAAERLIAVVGATGGNGKISVDAFIDYVMASAAP